MNTLLLNFHTDAGHGWIEVPKLIVRGTGKSNQISSCSYQDNKNVYLEEDDDAPLILNELKKTFTIKLNEINHNGPEGAPMRKMKYMWY